VPRKSKRYLTTFHPTVARTESSKISFSEPLPIEVKGRTTATGATRITYNFFHPDDFKQFHEIVREKALLDTFRVDVISSAKGDLASYQHLKLWRDPKSKQYTLSFCKNATAEKDHLEVTLNTLSLVSTKEARKDNRMVRIDFVSDTASLRPTTVSEQPRGMLTFSSKHQSLD
jgi:hypothetical protein